MHFLLISFLSRTTFFGAYRAARESGAEALVRIRDSQEAKVPFPGIAFLWLSGLISRGSSRHYGK